MDDQERVLPARRRTTVASLVNDRGSASVSELARSMDVSSDTIRRDLDALAEAGVLARTHGGAVRRDLARTDRPYDRRLQDNSAAKERIATAVAGLFGNGQTIFLNGGTTAAAVAVRLADHRDLTVVTNNLRVPTEIDPACLRDLYLLGGGCNTSSLVTIGPVEFPGGDGTPHRIRADVALLGVGGVSVSHGLTITRLSEARMIREMIGAADRTVVLADSSKFDSRVFAEICPLSGVDVLVTEAQPAPELHDALTSAGVELVIAP